MSGTPSPEIGIAQELGSVLDDHFPCELFGRRRDDEADLVTRDPGGFPVDVFDFPETIPINVQAQELSSKRKRNGRAFGIGPLVKMSRLFLHDEIEDGQFFDRQNRLFFNPAGIAFPKVIVGKFLLFYGFDFKPAPALLRDFYGLAIQELGLFVGIVFED